MSAVDLTLDEADSRLPEANVAKLSPEAALAHAQGLSGGPAQEYGTPKKRRVSGYV